jgi:hypothetical protein
LKRQGDQLCLVYKIHSLPPRLLKSKAYKNKKTGERLPAKCHIQSAIYESKDDILSDIMTSPFEDGIYEGKPGQDLIYPDSEGNELGVIDCRDRHSIQIKEC